MAAGLAVIASGTAGTSGATTVALTAESTSAGRSRGGGTEGDGSGGRLGGGRGRSRELLVDGDLLGGGEGLGANVVGEADGRAARTNFKAWVHILLGVQHILELTLSRDETEMGGNTGAVGIVNPVDGVEDDQTSLSTAVTSSIVDDGRVDVGGGDGASGSFGGSIWHEVD